MTQGDDDPATADDSSGDSSGDSSDDSSVEPLEFGDSLQWSEVDEDDERRHGDDPGRARRVRVLIAACIVGGLAIVVLTVFGVRALVSDLDDRRPTSRERTIAEIKSKYQQTYDSCVAKGGSTEPCSEQAARACVTDTRWRDDEAEQLTETCVFGPRR